MVTEIALLSGTDVAAVTAVPCRASYPAVEIWRRLTARTVTQTAASLHTDDNRPLRHYITVAYPAAAGCIEQSIPITISDDKSSCGKRPWLPDDIECILRLMVFTFVRYIFTFVKQLRRLTAL